MRSNRREEIEEVFDALDVQMDRACELSFGALTTPELMRMLERLEKVARQLPVPGHGLINQVVAQATPAELGGKLPHVVADRLRITRGEATRRVAEAADLGPRLLEATLAALIVAVLEEVMFRGALFGLLRKAMPWPVALALSSAIYSLAHFIGKAPTTQPVQWYSGLALLRETCRQPPPLVPAFFTLLVAGAILALAYQRTGALYFSMGLHAGRIFWLKSCRLLLHQTGGSQAFWGSDNLIDGWAALLILLVVFCLLARRRQVPREETG